MSDNGMAPGAVAPIYELDLGYGKSDRCPVGDGIELYYEVHGDGPPIVFFNQPFLIAPVWRSLTQSLRESTRCIFWDLRNQGASTPTDKVAWSDYGEDLRKLLDHLGLERVYLLGTSMSALAARDFTLAYPERVSGLMLVGPAFSPYGHRRRVMMTENWLESMRSGGLQDLWKHLYSLVFSDYTIEQGGQAMFLGLRESFVASHKAEQIESHLLAANTATDEPDKLSRIECPTHLMWGDSDWLWSESSREEALRLLPQATHQLIPRAGHLPYFEANEEFEAGVLRFVTECEQRGAGSAASQEESE